MSESMVYADLIDLFQNISRDNDLHNAAYNGHCDAFALAMIDFLGGRGVDATPVVIDRTRYNKRGNVIDTNQLSHVVVEFAEDTWDVGGKDAFGRWEKNWIQPSDGEEDTFDYNTCTVEELVALRQKQDCRDPDEGVRTQILDILECVSGGLPYERLGDRTQEVAAQKLSKPPRNKQHHR